MRAKMRVGTAATSTVRAVMVIPVLLVVLVCLPLVLLAAAVTSRTPAGRWLGLPTWAPHRTRAWLVELGVRKGAPSLSDADWAQFARLLAGEHVVAARQEAAIPGRRGHTATRPDAVNPDDPALPNARERLVRVAAAVGGAALGAVLLSVLLWPFPSTATPATGLLFDVAGPYAVRAAAPGIQTSLTIRADAVPLAVERAQETGFTMSCPNGTTGAEAADCTGRLDGYQLTFTPTGAGGLVSVTVAGPPPIGETG